MGLGVSLKLVLPWLSCSHSSTHSFWICLFRVAFAADRRCLWWVGVGAVCSVSSSSHLPLHPRTDLHPVASFAFLSASYILISESCQDQNGPLTLKWPGRKTPVHRCGSAEFRWILVTAPVRPCPSLLSHLSMWKLMNLNSKSQMHPLGSRQRRWLNQVKELT